MNKTKEQILALLGIEAMNSGVSIGIGWQTAGGDITESTSPIDNSLIAKIKNGSQSDYESVIAKAEHAFTAWKNIPAPQRGEVVRKIGLALRNRKEELGYLISLEMGKIYQEGLGEVQEMIDICDFAVGQSRLLNGYTMHSERPQHRIYDQYHPLGVVGVVTSFNFPMAVWAWNSMLAAIAGDVVVWKPSSKTPLTAIAVHNTISKVLSDCNVPQGVFNLIVAKSSVMGDNFLADRRVALISLTGSTSVGKHTAEVVGKRLGKTILELGGNNAVIITQAADLRQAIPSVVFGAVGTAGQRCTSTRRVIVHESLYEEVKNKLVNAYTQVEKKIGNPLAKDTLVGPLVDHHSVKAFTNAINEAKREGGKLIFGGDVLADGKFACGNYVVPAIVEAENHYHIVQEETFAPILYLIKYRTIEEAIALNNGVPQGLSSAIFTQNMRESELFLSESGSDCGIANVNTGTSGAEIGGAFGGEKDTGGGRESGSDAWKAYMRRQTNNINFGSDVPLAQGIKFDF